ncbi:MAG: hypothetical protein WCJ18_12095, partial [Planctomycetota bacterium]
AITGIAFALLAFTALGVAVAAPPQVSKPVPSNAAVAGSAAATESPSIGSSVPTLARRFFGRDLRKPRLPRHRSERPTSFSAENESITALAVTAIVTEDIHRPFWAEVLCVSPLSGHPLELLRPPSRCI